MIRKNRLLILLMLVPFVIRILAIGNHEYWFDEKVSVFIASQPVPALFFELNRIDNNPPFYFLILKAWSEFSTNVLFLRLLSVIFGTAAVGLTYIVARKLGSHKTALLTATFLTLSPLHVYFSTEIRMYALFIFESLLLTLLILKAQTGPSLFLSGLFILTETALLFTHYYAVFLILGLSIWCFLKKPRLNKWLFRQHLIPVLIFIPWLFYSFNFAKPGCWCFPPLLGIPMFLASPIIDGLGLVTLKDYLLNLSLPFQLLFASVSFLFIGLFFAGLRRNLSSIPAIILLVPVFLTSAAGLFSPIYSPRALIFTLPFYFLLVTEGIYSQQQPVKKMLLIATPILLALILLLQNTNPFFAKIPPGKEYLRMEKLTPGDE